MADRPKRRSALRQVAPSAAYYVGYVEDSETPEMIMRKFEELERVVASAKAQSSAGTAEGANDKENSQPAGQQQQQQQGQQEVTSPAAAPAQQPPTAGQGSSSREVLDESLLVQVFKQTSIFNVRAALGHNAVLLGAGTGRSHPNPEYILLDEAAPLSGEEDSSDEEGLAYLRGFWSDDDMFTSKASKRSKKQGRRTAKPSSSSIAAATAAGTSTAAAGGAGSGNGSGQERQQSTSHLLKALGMTTRERNIRHQVVMQYNKDTHALVRRKARAEETVDGIIQLRIPAPPLPTAWGRTIQPYDPTACHISHLLAPAAQDLAHNTGMQATDGGSVHQQQQQQQQKQQHQQASELPAVQQPLPQQVHKQPHQLQEQQPQQLQERPSSLVLAPPPPALPADMQWTPMRASLLAQQQHLLQLLQGEQQQQQQQQGPCQTSQQLPPSAPHAAPPVAASAATQGSLTCLPIAHSTPQLQPQLQLPQQQRADQPQPRTRRQRRQQTQQQQQTQQVAPMDIDVQGPMAATLAQVTVTPAAAAAGGGAHGVSASVELVPALAQKPGTQQEPLIWAPPPPPIHAAGLPGQASSTRTGPGATAAGADTGVQVHAGAEGAGREGLAGGAGAMAGSSGPAAAPQPGMSSSATAPSSRLEVQDMADSRELMRLLAGRVFNVVLISSGWEVPPATEEAAAAAGGGDLDEPELDDELLVSRLRCLPLPALCPSGFVFIWVHKAHIQPVFKQMSAWGYSYVESLTWVWLQPNNQVLRCASTYCAASHLTLFMFRKEGEGRDIQLRHQRNADAMLDCVRTLPASRSPPLELYTILETMLPGEVAAGRCLELCWLPPAPPYTQPRPGWLQLVQAPQESNQQQAA